MNLTLIKNFFVTPSSDKKHLESSKIGRVLRRSFRMRRPARHHLDRDKRKSGKILFYFVIQVKNAFGHHHEDYFRVNFIHNSLLWFIYSNVIFFLFLYRFIREQSRVDIIEICARLATRNCWLIEFWQVSAGASIFDGQLYARGVTRGWTI